MLLFSVSTNCLFIFINTQQYNKNKGQVIKVKKKIFLSVLLSATALLALSACGDEKPVNNGGSSSVVDNGGSQNQGL